MEVLLEVVQVYFFIFYIIFLLLLWPASLCLPVVSALFSLRQCIRHGCDWQLLSKARRRNGEIVDCRYVEHDDMLEKLPGKGQLGHIDQCLYHCEIAVQCCSGQQAEQKLLFGVDSDDERSYFIGDAVTVYVLPNAMAFTPPWVNAQGRYDAQRLPETIFHARWKDVSMDESYRAMLKEDYDKVLSKAVLCTVIAAAVTVASAFLAVYMFPFTIFVWMKELGLVPLFRGAL